jgi:hypothetical protein
MKGTLGFNATYPRWAGRVESGERAVLMGSEACAR